MRELLNLIISCFPVLGGNLHIVLILTLYHGSIAMGIEIFRGEKTESLLL